MKDKNGMTKHKRERKKKSLHQTHPKYICSLPGYSSITFCGYAPLVTPVL